MGAQALFPIPPNYNSPLGLGEVEALAEGALTAAVLDEGEEVVELGALGPDGLPVAAYRCGDSRKRIRLHAYMPKRGARFINTTRRTPTTAACSASQPNPQPPIRSTRPNAWQPVCAI